ncbi:MAG: hypothetical protein WCP70_08320 [Methanothrix sp.]
MNEYNKNTKDELASAQTLAALMLKSLDFSYAILLKIFLLDLYERSLGSPLDPKTFAETLKLYGECLTILNTISTDETKELQKTLSELFDSMVSPGSAFNQVLGRKTS